MRCAMRKTIKSEKLNNCMTASRDGTSRSGLNASAAARLELMGVGHARERRRRCLPATIVCSVLLISRGRECLPSQRRDTFVGVDENGIAVKVCADGPLAFFLAYAVSHEIGIPAVAWIQAAASFQFQV